MRKIILLSMLVSTLGFSQSIQLQNCINALRAKDYEKAKTSIDLAAVHDDTKGQAKMWMYRGKTYQAIYSDTSAKVRALDAEAEEKALDANINCLTIDKGKDIYKDDVKGPLVQSGAAANSKASWYRQNKQYDKALYCYDLLEKALPFDFDNGLKRNNITKEKLLFYKFEMYKSIPDKAKAMEYADKLIAINYKDPKVYTDIVKITLLDKDTTKALSYIEKGKALFEDNMELIVSELDIYLARKKTSELIDKLKKAIEVSPDNELLHFILAISYDKTKVLDEAEKEYLKAIELKPDYEPANYNLAVLYYNQGKDWNDKLNALPPKDAKIKEYEGKVNDNFKKAVTYFEVSYEATKDKKLKQLLRQLLLRLGETEKADKYK